MADLFDRDEPARTPAATAPRPLADRLRPARLVEVIGQGHLLGPDGSLSAMIGAGALSSLIFWGPPGVGKTTIARLLAAETDLAFEQISAIFSGVADLRKVFEAAALRRRNGRGTLLFVDEIHRFNKAQQDGFLPHMESGAVTLVGATTENPSFELNAALLSRSQVMVLKPLDSAALSTLLDRAEALEVKKLPLDADARAALIDMAEGDGRALLNMAEQLFRLGGDPMGAAEMALRVSRRAPVYDKSGDGHFNLISALHKAVRGSDPDAALYWLRRMLNAGEDPRYLARRIIRMAVEDIGLAEPEAVKQALAAAEVYERLGSPEGELALAQAAVYLALAPKSNALYRAYGAAGEAARKSGAAAPPKHILNAPTKLMKEEGYGAGYEYDHDAEDGFSGQNYFPDGMKRGVYYLPKDRGFERELAKRLDWFAKKRSEKS
ncbi:replication-associated recombination protein A [Pikeienuella piscinae]|uniref:Replication-associated recombination protein A n=1 Tax=Pikeienuella piscinae TaxID=2748098 RepID=A0A7M3T6H5_9RHOB|nr:replication-associated recombination protein A [Pikeienuella piscinae]QIE57606.1 replication-associated recombination protein A [Pikeienuella piscinae]